MSIVRRVRTLDSFKNLLFNGETLPFGIYSKKPLSHIDKNSKPLPRSTPSKEGVNASALVDLYNTFSSEKNLFAHTLIAIRHGKVISSGSWAPYTLDCPHITHSMCKSITGMAIGILIDEEKLTLDTKASEILIDKAPLFLKNTRNVTIRQLLTMQTGSKFNEANIYSTDDWVKDWFMSDTAFAPGSAFNYNSLNTYILSAIVQRITGVTLHQFIKDRIFTPLGIEDTYWETCPQGITVGGWGLYIKPEDAGKLGLLYLQKGMYNGEQFISEEWCTSATTKQVLGQEANGYGYQVWTDNPEGSFTFNGMFGQFVMVFPKYDLILVINSGSDNLFLKGKAIDIVKSVLLHDENFSDGEFKNPKKEKELLYITENLRYKELVQPKNVFKSIFKKKNEEKILISRLENLNNKTYSLSGRASFLPGILQVMNGNFAGNTQIVSFFLENGKFYIKLKENNVAHTLPIGFNGYENAVLDYPCGTFYVGTKGVFKKDEDDNLVLKLNICFTESSSSRYIKIFFYDHDTILMKFFEEPSIDGPMSTMKELMYPKSQPDNVKPVMRVPGELFEITDNELVNYNMTKIITPEIWGKLM